MNDYMPNQQVLHKQSEAPEIAPRGENAADPADSYDAVRVKVVGVVETSTGDDQFGIYTTATIPASAGITPGFTQILARDPLRQYAYVNPIDGPCILTTALEMAQNPANIGQSNGSAQTEQPQTSPAAGAQFTYTNNTGAAQELVGLFAFLATDAVVGNRFANIRITDAGGNTIFNMVDGSATPASSSLSITAWQGATQQNTATGTFVAPLPQGFNLLPGYTVIIGASSMDAGDQISAIRLVFDANTIPAAQVSGSYIEQNSWTPPIRHNDPVWCVNPGSEPIRVALMVERGRQP